MQIVITFVGIWLLTLTSAFAANDVSVPASSSSQVNAHLAQLITAHTRRAVDNVMVCGVTTRASRTQRGGKHGVHQILSLLIFPT